MTRLRDLVGQRFGRLEVLGRASNTRDGNARWRCRCDCGVERVVIGASLTRGTTRSCGCLALDLVRARRAKAAGNPDDRFWGYVSPEPNTGCWLWTAALDDKGYGRFGVNRRAIKAHRIAWEKLRGPIPAGLGVLHHCDNPMCVNAHDPNHLFLGTHADNMADMTAKGRHAGGRPKRAA